MKIITASVICLSMLGMGVLRAQDTNNQPLTIGDKVPDLVFPAINHTSDSFRISDAAGKLLLLEFWASSCAACVAQFPKLSGLQRYFEDRLIIMPLAINSRIRDSGRFFSENLLGDPQVQLPTAVVERTDSTFQSLFVYTTMPHVIWIGADQRILAITDHTAVNQANIEKALNGSDLGFRVKPILRFQQRDEVFLLSDTTEMQGSMVHPYAQSLYGSSSPQLFVSGDKRVLRAINMPVPGLYRYMYRQLREKSDGIVPIDLFGHKFVLTGDDFPYLDALDVSGDWDNFQMDLFRQENLFCYEFVAPSTQPIADFYKAIILDLDEKFGVVSSVESQVVRHGSVTLMPGFYQRNGIEQNHNIAPPSYFDKLDLVDDLASLANRLNLRVDFEEPISYSGPNTKFNHPIRLEIDDKRTREEILSDLESAGIRILYCEKLVEVLVLDQ